jgi:hypothetical protein
VNNQKREKETIMVVLNPPNVVDKIKSLITNPPLAHFRIGVQLHLQILGDNVITGKNQRFSVV